MGGGNNANVQVEAGEVVRGVDLLVLMRERSELSLAPSSRREEEEEENEKAGYLYGSQFSPRTKIGTQVKKSAGGSSFWEGY